MNQSPQLAVPLPTPDPHPPGNDNTPLVETVTLIADTMHCGLCMVTTEDALKNLPGVREARANLSMRRIWSSSTVRATGSRICSRRWRALATRPPN